MDTPTTTTTTDRRDGGFTLIELMVVVLVIGVLLAIAVPTFLGARGRAQDSVAKSSARTALSTASVLYTDSFSYSGITNTDFSNAEPSLSWVNSTATGAANASTGQKSVSWTSPSANVIVLAVVSLTGRCFAVRDDKSPGGGTTYASYVPDGSTTWCTGFSANASGSFGASW